MRYLLYSLILNAVSFGVIAAIFGIMFSMGSGASTGSMGVVMIMYPVILIPVLIFSFIIMKRRLNDFNQSGWLSLLIIVPLVNMVFGLMLLFAPGTKASNKYGPMPSNKNAAIINATAIVLLILVIAAIVMSGPMLQNFAAQSQMVK